MEDAGNDINAFLRIFFNDMFPQFSTNTVHFVGESIGGHWVPNFVTHISKRQQLNVPGTFNGAVGSIILLNAVISQTTSGDGASYDHFCSPESRIKFNQTACQAMEETTPECDYLSRQCVDTYDANICRAAFSFCANVHARWYNEYGPGQPDPYNDRFVCDPEAFACGNFDMSFVDYLNTVDVKKGLGLAPAFKYKVYNSTINRIWGERAPMAVPTTRELSFILDQTPTRVLVINGNNDVVV
jgi:carboxypeptidase C (cathepsin A)